MHRKFPSLQVVKSLDNDRMKARPDSFRSLNIRLAVLAAATVAMMASAAPSMAAGAVSTPRTASAPDRSSGRALAAVRSGEGWRYAPPPAWVELHAAAKGMPVAPGPLAARGGWHALLVDEQRAIDRNEDSGQYLMWRALITDASGLSSAGRVEVSFDPSYQKVLLHAFAVWRDGRRLDRLADARIELLRREAGLENESIDGRKTLLVILNDVRVGDVVEISYSILGQNPVHGPSHDGALDMAFDMPVDRLLASVTSRSTRRLHVQAVRTDGIPAVRDEGGVQHWQLERHDVAAIQPEDGTPSDYAVYPHVDYSDDADWHEVADWGTKLFKVDATLGPDLEHRLDAWRASGLKGQALVSAALSLVQDDVRYFSASLGENSHRPKVPARTWADRAGDCKDKTALLVAILQRLGFDAKPALVSSSARNSLHDMLPGHDVFDHAIVRLQLDGRTWWLDGTMTSQSTRLDTRSAPSVDWALVVAPETQSLEAVQQPQIDEPLVTYDHVWDTSDLSKPARLQLTVTTRGGAAEGYRSTIASGRLVELVDAITGHYRTRFQGYHQVGEAVVQDDRAENRLSVRIEGEVAMLGDLSEGALAIEVFPLRIADSLATPEQLQRSMPWDYEPPQTMSERIRLILPQPPHMETPLHREVSDPHFSLTLSSSESGHERILDWRFHRRDDVVLPADLAHFRDRITKARNDNDIMLTEPLVKNDRVVAKTREDAQKLDKDPRVSRDDEPTQQIATAYARRVRDDLVLAASGTTSQVGRRILIDRALQDTLLGEDDAAEADLGQVPADALTEPAAQYTRGLVLFTSGHFADAEKAFRAGTEVANPVAGPARRWIGIAAYHDGRLADAVRSLREAVQDESGDERAITLAWLFLAAQRQDHQGEAAIASYVTSAKDDGASWAVQLLDTIRAVAQADDKGQLPEEDWAKWPPAQSLLATLKKEPRLARGRYSQMMFLMSQLASKASDRGPAVAMLRLVAKMHATSAPEDICARTELRLTTRKASAELVDSARKAAASGDRRGAADILRRALADAPDDTDALLMLGRLETDRLTCEGLEPLTRAVSLRPDDPAIGIEFARVQSPCGARARAAALLAHWLADPRTPPAARAEGLAVRSMMSIDGDGDGRLDSAEKDAKAAVDIDAGLPIAWEAMLHVHDHQDKDDKALEDADRMGTAGAPPQQVALYRGMALEELKRDEEAEAELTRSLSVEPDNWIGLRLRAAVRLRRGNAEGSAQDARAWTRFSPKRPESWEALKKALAADHHAAEARDALDHEIALQPNQAALWADRAKFDAELDDHGMALADDDKALAIDKSDTLTWLHRSHELLWLNRGDEAVRSCLTALGLHDVPFNRSNCAVVEWYVGDHARAIATLDALLPHREEMETADQVYWFDDVGQALLSYGRGKEAVPFLESSLKRWPKAEYDRLFLYFARSLSGDEAAGRAELAALSTEQMRQWPGHLIDYAAHRLDDDALRRLASVDAPGNFAGQACEADFYIGLRHWSDGDVAAGQTLLARAVDECPRTFIETRIAKAWLAAGPGAAREASVTAGASSTNR
jgi:tetratricopeptide (TPR) repeat protein